jgi:hypothetical protein
MVIDRYIKSFNNIDPAITLPNDEYVEPMVLEGGEPSVNPSTPSQIWPKKTSLQSRPNSTESFSSSKEQDAYDDGYHNESFI